MPSEGSMRAGDNFPHLVGRSDELARLRDLADAAVEDRAQMVLLSGEAGIGKSSLVNYFLGQLADLGWGCHMGHCIEFADRPLPFGPIVSILRSVLLDNLDDVDDLVGHHRIDLAGLLPELRLEGADGASLAGDVDRLFDGISVTLIEAARRRPIAVLIEDIHWGDSATRDLLASLVHSLGSARVLLIVTERTATLTKSHPLRTWLAEQRRFPNVHSIRLEGLTREELAEHATHILGETPDSALIDELLDRTSGNAYFASELLMARRQGTDTLPTSLFDFLASRLQRLTTDEVEALRVVAISGGTVSHGVLVAMLPDLPVGPVVRSLFDASLVRVDGSDYSFRHALIREAILRDILPFEAEELHRRAAEAILADPQRGSTPSDLAGLALHWANANDPDRSLAAATEAARAAADVAAYKTASDMLLQALHAWPLASDPRALSGIERDQLLLQTVDYMTSCFRGSEAVDLTTDALATWAGELAPGRRALLLARMAQVQFVLGNPTAASSDMGEATELIGDEVSSQAAQVHLLVARMAVNTGQIWPALEAANRAVAIATTEGPRDVLVEALGTKALATGVTDSVEAGVEVTHEARRLALEEGLVAQVANAYRIEMQFRTVHEGRTDISLEVVAEGLAYAEKHCGPRWRNDLCLDLALGYVEAGRFNDAAPYLEKVLAAPLYDLRRLTVLQAAALHALGTGSVELAQTYLTDANEISERYQSAQETGFQNRILAELARRQGRLDDALELINKALSLQLVSDNVTFTRESIIEKVRIVSDFVSQRTPNSDQLVAEITDLVKDFNAAGTGNIAFRALMDLELAAVTDDIDPANAVEAIALLSDGGFRYEAAQARLLLIDHMIRSGRTDPAELERQINELSALSNEHGMSWVTERVNSLARTARVPLEKTQTTPASTQPRSSDALPMHLTRREIEVLSLVAEGLTNKSIGEQLYVSPRTVGTHVSNLLSKLGLSNRGEAAAAYHRLGLDSIDLRDPVDVA